jgi:hypothetical protein
LGRCARLKGQNRVPLPPAMITLKQFVAISCLG